jgi:hypothetical protein
MASDPADGGWLRRVAGIARWLFTPLALIFLVAAIWQSRELMAQSLGRGVSHFFILSVLAWMAAHLVSPLVSKTLLGGVGRDIDYKTALGLHILYLPARYIPGGVWHTVARVGKLSELGFSPGQLSAFVVLENLVSLSVALTFGGMSVFMGMPRGGWGTAGAIAVTAGIVCLFMLPRVIRHRLIQDNTASLHRSFLRSIPIVVLFWAVASTAFLFYMKTLLNVTTLSEWIGMAGAYLFSWGVGFMAVFAPQGVGVFELVFSGVLRSDVPAGALIGLIAGFRLVVLVADTLMWVGYSLIDKARSIARKRKTSDSI